MAAPKQLKDKPCEAETETDKLTSRDTDPGDEKPTTRERNSGLVKPTSSNSTSKPDKPKCHATSTPKDDLSQKIDRIKALEVDLKKYMDDTIHFHNQYPSRDSLSKEDRKHWRSRMKTDKAHCDAMNIESEQLMKSVRDEKLKRWEVIRAQYRFLFRKELDKLQ